jgi:hypothetical protein
MKHAEFMSSIVGYYGAYENKFVEGIILKKIATFPEKDLEPIFQKILSEIPRRGDGQNPIDIARLNSLFTKTEKDYEAGAVKIYNEITATGCSLDHIIIGDIRGQKALEKVFGTWPDFCRRDPDDEQWHRKNFIKAYCECEVEPDEIPRIMYGDSSNRDRIPNVYGDKDECKKYLEYSKPNAVRQLADTLTRDMRIGNEH